jgi:hypothetical protein
MRAAANKFTKSNQTAITTTSVSGLMASIQRGKEEKNKRKRRG